MDKDLFIGAICLDPEREKKMNDVNKDIIKLLPTDYTDFLTNFGEGEYTHGVIIQFPDEKVIPETFKDYTDFWEYDENFAEEDLLRAIQIGTSFDGDIVCISPKKKNKVFILPRHSDLISSYNTFIEAINNLTQEYEYKFFMPFFDKENIQITLIKEGKLKDIHPIHDAFLNEFNFDFYFDQETQPEYIIRKFGFRIRFDLVYKNTISISFQKQFKDKIQDIIDRISELSK